jgi:outer membrane receptor protein involved in Fe transport
VVTAEEARAITAGKIVQVSVTKGTAGAPDQFAITTRGVAVPDGGDAAALRGEAGGTRVAVNSATGTAGIMLIDGVRSDGAALRALRFEDIERVEIFKGGAARQLFDEPLASQGVIRVTTKAGRR